MRPNESSDSLGQRSDGCSLLVLGENRSRATVSADRRIASNEMKTSRVFESFRCLFQLMPEHNSGSQDKDDEGKHSDHTVN